MKKIIIGGAILFTVVGAAPFVNGLLMEKTVHQAVEDANTFYSDTGVDYSLEIMNYERGFFSSEIVWKVNLGSYQAIYGVDEVVFHDHAKHGYTKVVTSTNFENNPWFKVFVEQKLNGKNPFKLTTVYSVFGDIQTTFSFEAFSFDLEGETIGIKEGRFVVETDAELKNFRSSGSWLGFVAADKISLEKMEFDADLEMLTSYLWDGDINFSLDSFNVNAIPNNFSCETLKAQYLFSVDQTTDLISGETLFSTEKLITPSTTVKGAQVRFSVDNLSTKGYQDFMQVYTKTMSDIFANVAVYEDASGKTDEIIETQMASAGLQMIAAYEKLLQQGVELKMSDLLIKLPEGDVTGEITLRLLKDMTLMQFAPVVGQPALLLDILYLNSQFRLPATLVGDKPMLLAPIYPGMQTGVFIKEGDFLVHSAETRNGKFYLNDEEFILKLPQ